MKALPWVELEGQIIRKKRRPEWLVLAVKPEGSRSTAAMIQRHDVESCTTRLPIPVLHTNTKDCADFAILQAKVLVKGYLCKEANELYVDEIQLVACSPQPEAVGWVMGNIARKTGRFLPSVIMLNEDEESAAVTVQSILDLPPRPQRLAMNRFIRRIQGIEKEEREPRERLARTRLCEMELLERIETLAESSSFSWELLKPNCIKFDECGEQSTPSLDSLPKNIPENESQPAYRNRNRTRVEYLTGKKHPQILWITRRIQELRKNDPASFGGPLHFLDVGGGRGDLATTLALTFEDCFVTVVDLNLSSLQAGRDYSKELGIARRMLFVDADFQEYHQNPSAFKYLGEQEDKMKHLQFPPINVVVALHACGDLSDLALEHARKLHCPFVICPCCYTKRYVFKTEAEPPAWCRLYQEQELHYPYERDQTKVMGRLAELDERPEVSRRAMTLINSMRLHCLSTEYCVSLEEYERTMSKRNLVLVGTK